MPFSPFDGVKMGMYKRIWAIVVCMGWLFLCGVGHGVHAQVKTTPSRSVAEVFEEAQRFHLGIDRPVDYRQAYVLYQEVVKRDSQHKDALYNLAHICFAQKRYDLAADFYQRVIRIDPKDVDAQNNLGAVYQFQGKMAAAKAAYVRALSLDPNLATAYYNLAFIFFKEGDKEKAEKAIEQATKLDPQNPEFSKLEANIKGNMGKLPNQLIFMVCGGFATILLGYYFFFGRRGV